MKRIIYYTIMFLLSAIQITCAEELSGISCTNDLFFGDQWNLKDINNNGINFCGAKDITQGSDNIRIAIIDNGVFDHHSDLVVAENYYIDSNNYCMSDVVKYGKQGTHCAGIINARVDNGRCISGIAPNCYLISIAIESPSCEAYSSAFQQALSRDADVILCAWKGAISNPCLSLEDEISNALIHGRNGKGTVVVWASGDSSFSNTLADEAVGYPANSNDDILVVGAIKENGERPSVFNRTAKWSSGFGEKLDVVAPGVGIPTTSYYPVNGFDWEYEDLYRVSGTAAAAAHVAAIAGLLLSVNPNLTNIEVNDAIEKSAHKLSGYEFQTYLGRSNGERNYEVGYGLVDAYGALQELSNTKYIQNKTYPVDGQKVEDGKDTIIAGYAVTNSKPYGDVVIPTGGDVTFEARTRIELRPGFRAVQGSTFKAIIELPSQQSSAPSNVRRRELFTANNEEDNHDDAVIEKPQNNTFSILPNPVNAILHLQTAEELSQVKIYNLSGQRVLQSAQTDINVSALPQGMYILRAETTDGNAHQTKFIKQ